MIVTLPFPYLARNYFTTRFFGAWGPASPTPIDLSTRAWVELAPRLVYAELAPRQSPIHRESPVVYVQTQPRVAYVLDAPRIVTAEAEE